MDILQTKAYNFALRVARLAEHLNNQKKEFVLSRKILDSGTNIGLLVEEGKQGEAGRILFRSTLSPIRKRSGRTFF